MEAKQTKAWASGNVIPRATVSDLLAFIRNTHEQPKPLADAEEEEGAETEEEEKKVARMKMNIQYHYLCILVSMFADRKEGLLVSTFPFAKAFDIHLCLILFDNEQMVVEVKSWKIRLYIRQHQSHTGRQGHWFGLDNFSRQNLNSGTDGWPKRNKRQAKKKAKVENKKAKI